MAVIKEIKIKGPTAPGTTGTATDGESTTPDVMIDEGPLPVTESGTRIESETGPHERTRGGMLIQIPVTTEVRVLLTCCLPSMLTFDCRQNSCKLQGNR